MFFYKEDEDYSLLSLWIVEEKIIWGKYFINKKNCFVLVEKVLHMDTIIWKKLQKKIIFIYLKLIFF